jgi:hypothetical protein
MGGNIMKRIISASIAIMICLALAGCESSDKDVPVDDERIKAVDMQTAIESLIVKSARQEQPVVYTNEQYGFEFTLPASWKGYSIVEGKWEGLPIGGETPVESGPMISIRHPLWTQGAPRQDIPIMVFTTAQWDALQKEEFHIGAAPVGPSELGRNSKYVFALPARYNFAFPEGYEEVEQILKGKPLRAIEAQDAMSQ